MKSCLLSVVCTIANEINVTLKGVYLFISQICYYGQILLQRAAVNCIFSDNLTPLGVTFIVLAMVHNVKILGSPGMCLASVTRVVSFATKQEVKTRAFSFWWISASFFSSASWRIVLPEMFLVPPAPAPYSYRASWAPFKTLGWRLRPEDKKKWNNYQINYYTDKNRMLQLLT